MLVDPEIASPRVPNSIGAHTLIEITAEDGAFSMPLAHLVIGVSSSGETTRQQQRRHARTLLERLLSQTYPLGFTHWVVAHHSSGAPYLEGGDCVAPRPRISMAHAGPWAMATISTAASVGADIEQEKFGRKTTQLAEFMGWRLRGNTAAEFYHRWTLWEAYIKCRNGRLFAPGGAEFEELFTDSISTGDRKARTWHGLHLRVADGVQASVVLRTSEPTATVARAY